MTDNETRRLLLRGKVFEKWVLAKRYNDNLANIVKRMGYERIAIYGMGDIGYLLLDELMKSDLDIPYVIDKGFVYSPKPLKNFEDEWERVDLIIVTLPHLYESICSEIANKCDYKVISLLDMLSWG